jgi:hypothetical protein
MGSTLEKVIEQVVQSYQQYSHGYGEDQDNLEITGVFS